MGLNLLHEEVVLYPKCQSIHDNRQHDDDEDKLKCFVGLDPSEEEQGYISQGHIQQHFSLEEDALGDDDNGIPDEELDKPICVADSASDIPIHVLSLLAGYAEGLSGE